ncbi:MAG: hypothetical protein CM15mP46_3670 [Alphaproteobacteria bacterium]|nr:MAG: hypothetical protein CM15mP46_3670 [Alphaproteobacteria bacterium]
MTTMPKAGKIMIYTLDDRRTKTDAKTRPGHLRLLNEEGCPKLRASKHGDGARQNRHGQQ